MKLPIYLDYSSTTPVDRSVVNKMLNYLAIDGVFGNPSSRLHIYGWQAEEAVDTARNQIASLVGSDSREIIFTSGATESNNLAIKGAAYARRSKGCHIITAVTEHKAVLDVCRKLEQEGFSITWLVPPINGIITTHQLNKAIREDTILVSLMHVNNETGVIQDIASFGSLCRSNNILFHVDATQSVGKLPINLSNLPIDMMSFSGHKIYGPKGIGVLFVRRNSETRIEAQIHGGGHERGMRSGTLPVHQIVGMGEACYLASQIMLSDMLRLNSLRDRLWYGLKKIGGVFINGELQSSIATILNVNFHGIDGMDLIVALQDLAISTGSACGSANFEPSHVLCAMGLNKAQACSSIRFSLGRFTTLEEIDYAVNRIRTVVTKMRTI